MPERLTRQQMSEKYPNQWIGITNIKYKNDDGVTLESADVIYIDKSKDELLKMQVSNENDIVGWYTNENDLQLGLLGVL